MKTIPLDAFRRFEGTGDGSGLTRGKVVIQAFRAFRLKAGGVRVEIQDGDSIAAIEVDFEDAVLMAALLRRQASEALA